MKAARASALDLAGMQRHEQLSLSSEVSTTAEVLRMAGLQKILKLLPQLRSQLLMPAHSVWRIYLDAQWLVMRSTE